MRFFQKKSIESLINRSSSKQGLQKSLGAFDLTMLGVGAVIGTGIFVLTGTIAAKDAGPAIMLTFVLSGLACIFAALCYAELASTVPVSGSAYTYSYAVFGEGIAWILGWDLILEYGLASSVVASGWSGYVQGLLEGFGIHIPTAISSAFNSAKGTYVDVPAIVIALLITFVLSRGAKESTKLNNIMVIIKIAVVLLFIVVGFKFVKPENWTPFMPFGFKGVLNGAATAFLAYIGFDAVSSAAEEVKNPQKNLPIGIIASLLVCTVLYVAVSAVLTGVVPYTKLDVSNPVAFALQYVHQDWVAGFISAGALIGLTTVLFVMMYGQTRLFFSISRDGLLPKKLSAVSEKKRVPKLSIRLTGLMVVIFSGLIPIDQLSNLTNIGTLFAFIVVSFGVIFLRVKRPDLKRSFKVPFVPFIPILAILSCGYLMIHLGKLTWIGFVIWLLIGLIIYAAYGYRNSTLGKSKE